MTEVLGGRIHSRQAALNGSITRTADSPIGGSSLSSVSSLRIKTRSYSLETILDDSAPRTQLFLSSDSLASCIHSRKSQRDSCVSATSNSPSDFTSKSTLNLFESVPQVSSRKRRSTVSLTGQLSTQRLRTLRPRSVGSCLDIVVETREEDVQDAKWQSRAASCLNINASVPSPPPPAPTSLHPLSSSLQPATTAQRSHTGPDPGGPKATSSTSFLRSLPAPAVVRRCLSSLDVSKLPHPVSLLRPSVCVPASDPQPPQPKHEHSKISPSTCLCVCMSAHSH